MPVTPEPAEVPAATELAPDDAKLLTLARSARARAGAAEGAAVRDDIGRTYVAVTVELPSLRLSAVQAVVAAAVSSGQPALDAVAVVGDRERLDELTEEDRAVLADVGVTTVLLAGPDGVLRSRD